VRRAGSTNPRAPRRQSLLAGLVQLEAQQAALDGAVEKAVRALGIDPKISRQRRIARENRGLPTLEPIAQRDPKLRIQRRKPRFRPDAFAVGRIGHDEAGIALGTDDLAERTLLHVQPVGNAGMLAIGNRHAHRIPVHVGTQNATARRPGNAPVARLGPQALPEFCIVTAPTQEAKILALERGSGIRCDQSAFGEKRAGAAHGIEQHAAAFADGRPARAQQHGGGDVFLERRTAAFGAVAAPVQTLAGEIHREQCRWAFDVHMQEHVGALRFDVRPLARRVAQIVANRVLEQLGAVDRVPYGFIAAAAIAGQRRTRTQMFTPVDALDGFVHALRTAGIDRSQAQKHPGRGARP